MSNLTFSDKKHFEKLLDMSGGFVLDFTNSSFKDFFNSYSVDIYSEKYASRGESKAKRLRAFWEQETDALVSLVLSGLLEIWLTLKPHMSNSADHNRAKDITEKLCGTYKPDTKEVFLHKDFDKICIDKLNIESRVLPYLKKRLEEAKTCLLKSTPLACIFLCGSILEGILFGLAQKYPEKFNKAKSAPKDSDQKIKKFHEWTLGNFIDVSHEIQLLDLDVKNFSHSLRNFRNYIHPFQQMSENFEPDNDTATICFQVLKSAISDLTRD